MAVIPGWVWLVIGGWLLLAVAAGLAIGLVIRNRDRQIPLQAVLDQRAELAADVAIRRAEAASSTNPEGDR